MKVSGDAAGDRRYDGGGVYSINGKMDIIICGANYVRWKWVI